MKKFLCYDTNDAASGKINVDSRGMLKPNSTVPSGSTPYQQLVTDGNGNTVWEDRLAYDAAEEQVIFSQEDIAFTEYNGLYNSVSMPITAINAGEKLCVDFDGKTYDCIAYSMNPDASDVPVLIGNGSIMGISDDTGEPFLIAYVIEEQRFQITTTLTSPTHTVSISRVVETVHMIPQKFLPEKTKVYVRKDDSYMYFDSERTKKLSAENFISAVNSGGIDFISLDDSSLEVHLQMINYKTIKTSGTVIAFIASVSSDGSTINILGRSATSAFGGA